MGIDELNRWHWVVIGIVVGLMFAAIRVWALSDPPPDGAAHSNALEFETQLMQPPLKDGHPFVTHVIVYPPIEGKNPVRFDQLTPTPDRKGWTYQSHYMVANTPYVSKLDPLDNGTDASIVNFLERAGKANPAMSWHYAWWAEPQWQYALWTLGSVIVIGGAWPTVLNVLVGAGFGPKKKEKKYDLDRFGKYKEQEKGGEKKVITAEDQAKVEAVAAKLEEELGGFGTEGASTTAGAGAAAQAAARKLDGGPVEQVAVQQDDEDKEYKGEFYPVARTPGHKHDEPGHEGQ